MGAPRGGSPGIVGWYWEPLARRGEGAVPFSSSVTDLRNASSSTGVFFSNRGSPVASGLRSSGFGLGGRPTRRFSAPAPPPPPPPPPRPPPLLPSPHPPPSARLRVRVRLRRFP